MPAWERAWHEKRAADDALRCPHCGQSRLACADADKVWYPQRIVCHASMQQRAAARKYDALHEAKPWHDGTFAHWSAEESSATPFHFMDGVTVIVTNTDIQPDDNFLGGAPSLPDENESF